MTTCPIPADRCGTCDDWHGAEKDGWGLCFCQRAQSTYYGPKPCHETALPCDCFRRRNVQRVSTCSRS